MSKKEAGIKKETAEEVIKALTFVLEHSHGGGSWRRVLIMKIAEYEKVFSAQKEQ